MFVSDLSNLAFPLIMTVALVSDQFLKFCLMFFTPAKIKEIPLISDPKFCMLYKISFFLNKKSEEMKNHIFLFSSPFSLFSFIAHTFFPFL